MHQGQAQGFMLGALTLEELLLIGVTLSSVSFWDKS